ncbi:alpha/beta hydrolase [Arthrobacter russicus]|uniref:Acetyl esterase/lipase n=1 Tax=Arthrobacter russicus TaxID=172040 RepID=A0ABU1J775_9MICC|nr:alpha/beta hydrolase [Arthrobacter russicus]MDR6268280.1 acetyl esterase/lipase [Arthrobacter russicus]
MINFVSVPESVLSAQRKLNQQIAAMPLPAPNQPDAIELMRSVSRYRPAATELEATELGIPGVSADSEILLRVYRPEGELRGVVFNIHGGGFALGSRRNDDAANDLTARSVQVATVAVEYRLTPEHPYPAGLDDCVLAATWLAEHTAEVFGTERLVMAGGSAGAYYAVQTLLRLREGRPELFAKFAAASLVFGVFDLGRSPSVRAADDQALVLTSSWMVEFIEMFLPGTSLAERQAPELSPMFADLRGLPPALFTVGDLDPLLDDSMFLAARWLAAGNSADLDIWPEAPHAFLSSTPPVGQLAQRRINEWIDGLLD